MSDVIVDEAVYQKIVQADNDTPESVASLIKAEVDKENIPPTPVTPKAPRTPKSGSKRSAANEDGENDVDVTPTKKAKPRKGDTTPRQRKTSGKPMGSNKIATSVEELSVQDRLLLTMKDAGKSWSDIIAAWKDATGDTPGKSTLPNRYARLKANITQMKQEDQEILLIAYKKVHEKFERDKWDLIKKTMEDDGADNSYTTATIQKQYKKLSDKAANVTAAAATTAILGPSEAHGEADN